MRIVLFPGIVNPAEAKIERDFFQRMPFVEQISLLEFFQLRWSPLGRGRIGNEFENLPHPYRCERFSCRCQLIQGRKSGPLNPVTALGPTFEIRCYSQTCDDRNSAFGPRILTGRYFHVHHIEGLILPFGVEVAQRDRVKSPPFPVVGDAARADGFDVFLADHWIGTDRDKDALSGTQLMFLQLRWQNDTVQMPFM